MKKKVLIPPIEYIRVDGRLVRYDVWRKQHPLTSEEIAQNRLELLKMFGRR